MVNWGKSEEAQAKLDVAIVNRLNEVIRAIGIVARIEAKKP